MSDVFADYDADSQSDDSTADDTEALADAHDSLDDDGPEGQYHGADSTPTYDTRDDALAAVDKRERTSDDVDPRKLVSDPGFDEIRWYYRNSPFAPTIVNKPVEDAFKHGYMILEEPTGLVESFFEDWEPYRQRARKKARRDGVSFLYYVFEDDADSPEQPVNGATGYEGFNVLTLDQLEDAQSPQRIAPNTEYDAEQLRILEQGIVIVEDISSPDHHELVGVIYEINDDDPNMADGATTFIHADRLQHFVEGEDVDGPSFEDWVGSITGHSVLGPVFHQLKSLAKASWALGQSVYRYSSPLHVVEMERQVEAQLGSDIEQHQRALNKQLRNINSMSDVTLPPGHEMNAISSGGELDSESKVAQLIEMVCAGTEFTKTVLMGTQTGTVSGSESDIKNYFNQVQRYQETTAELKMREATDKLRQLGAPGFMPNFIRNYQIEWDEIFEIDTVERMEAMRSVVTAITSGVTSYILTPEEARSVLEEQWAMLSADVDLDELTETDLDTLERVNTRKGKQYPQGRGPEYETGNYEGNRRAGNNGGGQPEGQNRDESNPVSDGDGSVPPANGVFADYVDQGEEEVTHVDVDADALDLPETWADSPKEDRKIALDFFRCTEDEHRATETLTQCPSIDDDDEARALLEDMATAVPDSAVQMGV